MHLTDEAIVAGKVSISKLENTFLPAFDKVVQLRRFLSTALSLNMATSSDVLFSSVEQFHTGRPWGRFLDAGTGLHSVKWIQNLPTSSWTAITADDKMRKQILDQQIVAERMRQQDQLLVGNWMDSAFVKDLGTFDTILADYLIGAVEGFSPYEQDAIISK